MVEPVSRLADADRLKKKYLKDIPEPDAEVDDYWARYRQDLLPRRGLAACSLQSLKDFATTPPRRQPRQQLRCATDWKRS